MAAFLKGQRYFYDAVVKKKESLDSVVDIVAKYSRTEDRKVLRLGVGVTELTPNGEMDLKEIQDDKGWYFQKGLFKCNVDHSRIHAFPTRRSSDQLSGITSEPQ